MRGDGGMSATFIRFSLLAFLTIGNCFAQQPNQLIYIEGTAQKADGSPVAGVPVVFSNGFSAVTNSSGHYFGVVPSGFTGSSTATWKGINFSPMSRSYNTVSV